MQLHHLLIYIASYCTLFAAIFFILTFLEKRKAKTPALKTYPHVSVIIPAYNEEHTLPKTVHSVLNLHYPKNKLQTIIVDDGSIDSTYKVAQALAKKAKNRFPSADIKILRQENQGKGAALNNAIAIAKGELIASLDADSTVIPSALTQMVPYFQDEQIMAVTPSLKIDSPKTFWQRIQHAEYMYGIFLRKTFAFLNAIHVTPGPFSIYRKRFFQEHGPYDENNPTEDIEIALRIQDRGYKIENAIAASVYTSGPPTFSQLLNQRMRWYYGFTKNLANYKGLFHPKHKDLSTIILPTAILFVILPALLLIHFLYKILSSLKTHLINLPAINFDVGTLIKTVTLHDIAQAIYSLLFTPLIIFALILIPVSITFLIIAKKASKEKKPIKVSTAYFILFYWIIYPLWWTIVFIYKSFGGKIKWGGKKH